MHLRNSNKQHLILTKFFINNASSISNQSAKFRLNLPKQTKVTVAYVRSPPNTSVLGLWVWRHAQSLWNWSVL